MKFFGEPWDVPALEGQPQVPTPVGEACGYCDVEIVEGDRGFIVPHLGTRPDGRPVASEAPWHRECMRRTVIRPLEHLDGRCTCREGNAPEAVPTTPQARRADAIEAWERATGRPAYLP